MFHNFCYNKHSFQSKQILKSATVLHFKREIFRPFALRRTHPSEMNPILVLAKKPPHTFSRKSATLKLNFTLTKHLIRNCCCCEKNVDTIKSLIKERVFSLPLHCYFIKESYITVMFIYWILIAHYGAFSCGSSRK